MTAFMVKRAEIKPGERVLEIGTGRGALTKELQKASKNIEAFEIDEDNLRATAALGLKGVKLHLGDGFSKPRSFDVLVSSVPYSESATLVEWLASLRYGRAVVLLQKDFVDKLVAPSGDGIYRAISVISQISSDVRPLRTVERDAFNPPPRVTSVVATITPKRLLSSHEIQLIKRLFSQKRRKLGAALKHLGLELPAAGTEELSKRVGMLSADEIASLLGRLKSGQSISD